ncbi:hypothetical protein HOU02_gp091 [Caulobacter phage CcrBL9]|uniref:Uncharacterized protein n=1 Tax=Caulobacter phage CcrBL9 TaxID=2283270 RepID=A0A385EDN0_9CAUD|nr:hypothetical protein HOU02_gp091 [Caulobacter phage CcrBL9]AXQ69115.1 hypothetical protein CcrBL9_gp091 [Caulobacter phage CcrBL9]
MTIALIKALATAAEHGLAEALAGKKIYPDNEHMLAALMEEVGEVAEALLEAHRDPDNAAKQAKVYAEAMQVVALGLRIGLEGSGEFSYEFRQEYADAFKTVEPPAPKKASAKASPKKTTDDLAKDVEQQKAIDRLIDEMRQINKRPIPPYEYPVWVGGAAPRAMWTGGGSGVQGDGVGGGCSTYAGGGGGYSVNGSGGGAHGGPSFSACYPPINAPEGVSVNIAAKLPAKRLSTVKDDDYCPAITGVNH